MDGAADGATKQRSRSQPTGSAFERALPLVVAAVGLAWGAVSAAGVGDAANTGIVEDGLGGAGTAAILVAVFVGPVAVVVGLLDGLVRRLRSRAGRIVLRTLLVGGLGFWAGLWVWAVSDLECDGTCLEADGGLVVAALAVAVAAVLVEQLVAALVGRRVRRGGAPG